MHQKALTIGGSILLAAAIGCGSDKTTAPPLGISGNYMATQWVTTGSSGQTNQILAGSTLNMALNADGTTSGVLHVAASGGNSAFDADMAGTWTKSGNTVTFTQTADTFVRNMTFNIVPNGNAWSLSADQVIGSTRIQLTLDQVFLVAVRSPRNASLSG